MSTVITIDTYTFDKNPSSISDTLHADRKTAVVETYSSVAVFSWGVFIIGKTLTFNWDYMKSTQYDSLMTLFLQDKVHSLNFNGVVYSVDMQKFYGTYFIYTQTDPTIFRKDVNLELLILG